MYRKYKHYEKRRKRRNGHGSGQGMIWPLVMVMGLLAVPHLDQAAIAWNALVDCLQLESQVIMSWPCNESDSLALASDSSSKRYSFRSDGEEMQVFASTGGTVVKADDSAIVISHGNGPRFQRLRLPTQRGGTSDRERDQVHAPQGNGG